MASREEVEAAAAARFLKSDEGKTLIGWMRRMSKLDDTVQDPEASDHLLRNIAGRQWLVNNLILLAKRAE